MNFFLFAAQYTQQSQQTILAEQVLFIHGELFIEHLTSQHYRDLKVDVFICSLSHHCDACFHVSDVTAEEEGTNQAGSSLPAVELPRKRKGDVEERSNTHIQ